MVRHRTRAVGTLVAIIASALVAGSGSERAEAVNFPQDAVVSTNPVDDTPWVMDGNVNAIARAGDIVVVGGYFTTVRSWKSPTDIARTNLLAFSESTGQVLTAFNPSLTGEVRGVAISSDGQYVYAGGTFTDVNGVPQRGVTKLRVADGERDPGFIGFVSGGVVNDLVLDGDTNLYLAGTFLGVNGLPRPKLAQLDAATGALSSDLDIAVTDQRAGVAPSVRKIDVSADGTKLVLIGNFLTVGGLNRPQVAMIDLTTTPNVVSAWHTNKYTDVCSSSFDTYMRDVDFSPDGSYLVIITTGGFRFEKMCDTVARFETLAQPNLEYTWIGWTGGDTLYSVAVTNAAVYEGGHQRWMNNAYAADQAGAGAVERPGISALDPATGVPLSWNPTRDRGSGAFALVATDTRLYVGSDTNAIGDEWHPRLAAFPLVGGAPNPQPQAVDLPVRVHQIRGGVLGDAYFDGANVKHFGPVGTTDWSTVRAAFHQLGSVYYVDSAGVFRKAPWNGADLGASTDLSAYPGYVVAPTDFDKVDLVAFSGGRIFYRRTNDSRLFWRWFSFESNIVSSYENIASSSSTASWTGMEAAGSTLYYSTGGGTLSAAPIASDGTVDVAASTVVGGSGSPIVWGASGDFFFTHTNEPAPVRLARCAARRLSGPHRRVTSSQAPPSSRRSTLCPARPLRLRRAT